MFRPSCYLFFSTFAVAHAIPASSSQWPYLQIYPPVNESDGRTPLFYAAVFSFGGDYVSIAALPGIQIALDYINSEPSILPGYTLHYTLMDSQCNHSIALESYFHQLNTPPTKVGWMGSGCSPATEPTAELTHYYNITHVSCVSSSKELANRPRFRYYFQLLATEVLIAQGFFGIISHFGWKRVSIIAQDENLFTAAIDALKELLTDAEVKYIETRFRSDDGIDSITDFFDADTRIYVLAAYSPHARDLICKASRLGFHYPKYMFITYGWYADNWWTGPGFSAEYNCTDEERATVLPYTLAAIVPEFPTEFNVLTESGINASNFKSKYFDVVEREINQEINLTEYIYSNVTPFVYSYNCHEAALAFAYALNETITDLIENSTLNREAAELSDLPEGENFTMANFTYANSAVVSRMFTHLQGTSFLGISEKQVRFTDQGTRDINEVIILQYQFKANDSNELFRPEVALAIKFENSAGFQLAHNSVFFYFPDEIPNDGIPIEEVVKVSLGLSVLYMILATAGIVFAVACLTFILHFRTKMLIRLSSPNLNYIIVLGAIILYLNVITFVIPTTDKDIVSVLCNINPWLTTLGYSLCYGTILIKMIRVWIIFNKPVGVKKDYTMFLFVLCLVVIDLVILGTYTLVEGRRENLGVKLTSNRELPQETFGLTAEVHSYFLYVCESSGQVVVYAVLYGYKGLLQLIALLLAFRTRKVKVKGLDDSKYIAAAIYITSIVLAVTTISTYTLMDYVNVYPAVVGMGFLLGTTMILGLVFVPRIVELYKDPDGKNISLMITHEGNSTIDNNTTSEGEIKELQRRVIELETCLKQYTSVTLSPNFGVPPHEIVSDTEGAEDHKVEQI